MAKHFNCWSEALKRPVTVIKPIKNEPLDPLEADGSNNGEKSLNRPEKIIIVKMNQNNEPNHQQSKKTVLLMKHICNICGYEFPLQLMTPKYKQAMSDHAKNHALFRENLPYEHPCSRCPRRYKTSRCLIAHFQAHHQSTEADPISIHPERIIKKQLDTMPPLLTVQPNINQKIQYKYKCLTCGKGFEYKNKLFDHERIHTDSRPYKCLKCPKSFRTQIHLYQHNRIHKKDRPVLCTICEEVFKSQYLLHHHIKNIHSIVAIDRKEKFPRLYECFQCKFVFNRFMELRWHMNEHIDWLIEIDGIDAGKLFACQKCNKAYAEKPLLMHHAATFHKLNRRLLSCEFCEIYFQTKAEFDEHRKQCVLKFKKHRRKCIEGRCFARIQCEFCPENCPQTFNNVNDIELHVRVHTQEKPYDCICDESFAQFSQFERHIQGHMKVYNECNDKLIYKCAWCEYSSPNYLLYTIHKRNHTFQIYECDFNDCKASFDFQQKLVEHVQNSHTNQLKCFKCKKCSMEFPLNILLLDHSLIHMRESEMHLCFQCGKSFNTGLSLKRHKAVHLEKTFECTIGSCSSRFKTKYELTYHVNNVHANSSKEIICDVCKKTFKTQSTYQNHKKEKHKFGRRFQCPQCPMRFYAKFHLQNHARTHTGEKPFKCEHSNCNRVFAQKGELSSHIRVHLGPTPYKCNETNCGKSFRLVTQLRKHSYEHSKPSTSK